MDSLISRGADVNAKGLYNLTGLVWASGRGHYEIVELLLEHNAKVDAGDKYGTTCLIWASRAGNSIFKSKNFSPETESNFDLHCKYLNY